jgi:sugar phosphate isomerase/epimerase
MPDDDCFAARLKKGGAIGRRTMRELSRRLLLQGVAASGALASAGCVTYRAGSPRFTLGMTDATIRPELARDYPGTLRALKAMGYTHFGFRLSSPDPRDTTEPTAEAKASMVRDAGLELGPVRFTVSNRPIPTDPQIDVAGKIGARILALTIAQMYLAAPDRRVTRAQVEAYVPQLDQLGAKVRAAGMTFAYHNHDVDLVPTDGVRPLDLMIAGTDPRNVSFEIDLAWAFIAGVDPLSLIERLGSRVVSMHLKDVRAGVDGRPSSQFAAPGEGMMNYAAILPRLERLTGALGLVEVDNPPDGMAAAAAGARFVRRLWKA